MHVAGVKSVTTILLLCVTLGAGTAAAAGPGAETAIYRGELSSARLQSFFQRVAGQPLKRLRITSGGGDVEAGIDLGYWVFDRGLDVEVEGYCLSSCANYVFPAGASKTVLPGGVVAWHGNYRHLRETGLWMDDARQRVEKYGESPAMARNRALITVNNLVTREAAFFRHIGVDEYVCWVGKMPPHNAPDYYALGPADLARFGIRNVQVPLEYDATDFSRNGFNIVYLRLAEPVVSPADASGGDQEGRPDGPEQPEQDGAGQRAPVPAGGAAGKHQQQAAIQQPAPGR